MPEFPPAVERLFWEVDPRSIDLEKHRAYVMQRVMSRGTWEAMKWLLATYSAAAIRDYLESGGARTLPPKMLAFWALMSDADVTIASGGGRPRWADA